MPIAAKIVAVVLYTAAMLAIGFGVNWVFRKGLPEEWAMWLAGIVVGAIIGFYLGQWSERSARNKVRGDLRVGTGAD